MIPLSEAVGMVIAHDITEIRQGEYKGRAFKKGRIVREEDIEHLRDLGKENLFVLSMADDEMHEDEAAYAIATALMGEGVAIREEPKEGKINIVAARDGLLTMNKKALLQFNMLGEVMCATLHGNTLVKTGQVVAGTRAIPLVIKKKIVEEAVAIANRVRNKIHPGPPLAKGGWGDCESSGVIEVKELRKPRAGIVITGNEIFYGRKEDAFAPVIRKKVEAFGGEIVRVHYAPDDASYIRERLEELIEAGADLLITTGGMSVDPDDVTRFAIRDLGATDITYGSAVLPGAMFLVAYVEQGPGARVMGQGSAKPYPGPLTLDPLPILGIPACGMYHKITIFDLIVPRVLAGEKIGRKELAELGYGGLCQNCTSCSYPACSFGKV